MKQKKFLDGIRKKKPEILNVLLCLGLSILISFVYYNYGSVKTVINTAVEIKDDGMMVATEKDGQPLREFSVRVTVKSADKVDESAVHAFVDLRSRLNNGQYVAVTDEGVYDFPVVVEVNAPAAASEFNKFEYSPKTVKLKVEHKTEEWIKIIPTFSGELSIKGYEIYEKTLEPDMIKISGGRSIVETAKAEAITTEAIDLKRITNKFMPTSIDVTPNFSRLDSRLKISVTPESKFTLTVKLSPIQGQQNYNGVKVGFANLMEDLEITNDSIYVSVSLKGSEINLEKIDPSGISVTADCVSVKGAGTYEIPLTVVPPPGTSILDQPSSIRIWVKEVEKAVEESLPAERQAESEGEAESETEVLEKVEEKIETELEEVQEQELL